VNATRVCCSYPDGKQLLNQAFSLLSQVDTAFESKNFTGTIQLSKQAIDLIQMALESDVQAKSSAESNHLTPVVSTVIAVISVLLITLSALIIRRRKAKGR